MDARASSRHLKAASKFVKLLLEDRLLLRALLESEALHSEGPVGAAIECIFFSEGQDVELIKVTIAKAVELTTEPELLFRQDSVYTDVASKFMRYHGAKYLHKALKTPITSLIQRVKAGEEFNIDASRATQASAERLMQTTEEVLKSVIAKASIIPSEIRTALGALVDATEAKFGAAKRMHSTLGVFWLRFLCPAIVDPVQAGVVRQSQGPIAGDVQSALLALSKTVKACADGHIPDNLSTVAAQTLKEISNRWQSRIDACFVELRQASTRTTQKGDHKDALLAGVTLLKMLSKRMGEVSRILKNYGALNTGRALEKILDVAFDTEKHSEDLKAPAPVPTITTDSTLEVWTNEQVVSWLDLLGLTHHTAAFVKLAVTGKELLSLEPQALTTLGVEREEEQWVILQSIRDNYTIRQRYKVAAAQAEREGGRSFPSLDASVELAAVLTHSRSEDSSTSVTSGTITARSPSPRLPSPMPAPTTTPSPSLTASGTVLTASLSAPVGAKDGNKRSSSSASSGTSNSSSPVPGMPDTSVQCLYKVARGKEIRMINGRRTDSFKMLQFAIENEFSVRRADQRITYQDTNKRTVDLESDADWQVFLATQGNVVANDFGSFSVYRLKLAESFSI